MLMLRLQADRLLIMAAEKRVQNSHAAMINVQALPPAWAGAPLDWL